MIFDKPKILVLIKRQSIMVVDGSGKVHTIAIPQEIVRDLEIVNHGNFVKVISDFIKSINAVKVEAIVVFAKEVLFEKFVQGATVAPDIQEAFFSQVPIARKNLLKKSILFQNGVNLVCANGDFIRTLRLAFRTFQIKISAAVPASIYAISGGGNSISVADALAINGNKQLMEKGNLIVAPLDIKNKDKDKEENDKEILPENTKSKLWHNQKVQLGLGVSLIAGAVIIILFGLGIVKNPLSKPKPTPIATAQSQLKASPVPKVSSGSQATNLVEATSEASASSKEASASPVFVP